MGKKVGKSEKSSLAGVDFGEFPQGLGGVSKEKGTKKDPHGLVQGNCYCYCYCVAETFPFVLKLFWGWVSCVS